MGGLWQGYCNSSRVAVYIKGLRAKPQGWISGPKPSTDAGTDAGTVRFQLGYQGRRAERRRMGPRRRNGPTRIDLRRSPATSTKTASAPILRVSQLMAGRVSQKGRGNRGNRP